ncbi:MAG: dihydroneopterin aldolase [Muribaculaceae bacterium]|nr:dihydroneopterin aldolase [Muribaculaceae bacterium]
MKGTIEVDNLKVTAHHGVMEQERVVGNRFEVTVHVDCDFDEAARLDNVDLTVDYAKIVEIINEEMAKPSLLIETVARRIAMRIADHWRDLVIGGMVRVAKITPPIPGQMDSVAVVYRW